MTTSQNVTARILYDCRGYMNIEMEMQTVCGLFRSFANSQITYQEYDSLELRDGDRMLPSSSVMKTLEGFRNKIKPVFSNIDITDIFEFDRKIVEIDDSSDNRMSTIGTNISLPLSQCAVQASAAYYRVPLYKHIMNLFEPDLTKQPAIKYPNLCFSLLTCSNNCPRYFREIYVISKKSNLPILEQVKNFSAVKSALYSALGGALMYSNTGAFVVEQENTEELLNAVNGALGSSGVDVQVIIDVGAGDIINAEGLKYNITKFNPSKKETWIDGAQLSEKLCGWTQILPIYAFVDPFSYVDLGTYQEMRGKIGGIKIFGQQLFSTKTERIMAINGAHRGQVADGLILQLSNVGLVSKSIECAREARKTGLLTCVVTGYGDAVDSFLSHFAVGINADYFFIGGLCRGEKIEKVNELLRIFEVVAKSGALPKEGGK